jgi:hypothetical protein
MRGSLIASDTATATQFTPLIDLESKLRAHALTLALAQPFTDLYKNEWIPLRDAEDQLVVDQMRAQAQALFAARALDQVVTELEKVHYLAVGKDVNHPNFAFFFGKKRAYEIRQLGLANKLEAVSGWVDAVNDSPFTSVKALGAKLADRINAGASARDALEAATEALRQFRTIGPRKAFTDKFNALRKSTVGKLAEMPHSMPGEGLPKSFADWFFVPSRKAPPQPSSADIAEEMAAREAQFKADMEDLQQRMNEALGREKAEAEQDASEAQRLADLAEAKKEQAAAKAKVKSLAKPKRSRRSKK